MPFHIAHDGVNTPEHDPDTTVNHRLVDLSQGKVRFRYKDYRDSAKSKVMALSGTEFLRRFTMYILPARYRKVRHFGFLANASKKKSLTIARVALRQNHKTLLTRSERKALAKQRLLSDITDKCPCCKTGQMITVDIWVANKDPPNQERKHMARIRTSNK